MTRGKLDIAVLQEIDSQLPIIGDLQDRILRLAPDFISMKCDVASTIPSAATCLIDALNTIEEIRYSLHEAYACQKWYLLSVDPPNEHMAAFYAKYFADNSALRLYSAGEHLAQAIVDMREIGKEAVAVYAQQRTSLAATIGKYMQSKEPTTELGKAVATLGRNPAWRKAIDYRNSWVHSQPPLVDGLGIVYKRGPRWKLSASGNSYELGIGGGDEPGITPDGLIGFILPAFSALVSATRGIVECYVEILSTKGIGFSADGQMEVSLF